MKFEIIGPLTNIEMIAAGPNVRVRSYLRKAQGHGRWRKVKGVATVRLPNGAHPHGGVTLVSGARIGKRDVKIKRYLM